MLLDEEKMTAFTIFYKKNFQLNSNQFELIKFLVEKGANLNDRSPLGNTALLYAVNNQGFTFN